ncbi:hypothetical protein BV25DRAFT_159761 [Artomyces pyxidatus]|uniref:Uncharacterized protein n=1 Tax=Artomyces pyxidatus TaxID=48021 RepID=A0ACB8T8Z7_9AGAM|nr:hypothetical protein BV25DRAFT_159761 [Artomyces pyxidatus]
MAVTCDSVLVPRSFLWATKRRCSPEVCGVSRRCLGARLEEESARSRLPSGRLWALSLRVLTRWGTGTVTSPSAGSALSTTALRSGWGNTAQSIALARASVVYHRHLGNTCKSLLGQLRSCFLHFGQYAEQNVSQHWTLLIATVHLTVTVQSHLFARHRFRLARDEDEDDWQQSRSPAGAQ